MFSLVLTLNPRASADLPGALGRAAHAALLRAIAASDPGLAQALHEDNGARPFTCSSMLGSRKQGVVLPEINYTLRYTALTPELGALLPALFQPGTEIELDQVAFVVKQATCDPARHSWAAQSSFEDLSARWLLARATPESRIGLQFASPTAFKQAGKQQLFPLPDLVFGNLLEKWNAFAPVALPDETRRFAAECLAASRFEIETHAAPFKNEGAVKIGTVGRVSYSALNKDRYWLSIINLLADFAQFAGVGVNTAMGMGQARRMKEER